jgi:hypothetical protein
MWRCRVISRTLSDSTVRFCSLIDLFKKLSCYQWDFTVKLINAVYMLYVKLPYCIIHMEQNAEETLAIRNSIIPASDLLRFDKQHWTGIVRVCESVLKCYYWLVEWVESIMLYEYAPTCICKNKSSHRCTHRHGTNLHTVAHSLSIVYNSYSG